ncbi:MAG: 50S ribosomal protein L35 [Clostridia bacterium]
MPKQKSHSGSAKRFTVKKSGKVKRSQMGKNHILTKKTTKRTRHLRAGAYVDKVQAATVRRMLPY